MRKFKWLSVCLALILLITVFSGLSVSAEITGATFTKDSVFASAFPLSRTPATPEATVRFDGADAYPSRGGVDRDCRFEKEKSKSGTTLR